MAIRPVSHRMCITGWGRFLPDWTYDTGEIARMWKGNHDEDLALGIRERRWAGELDPKSMTVHPGPLGPDPHRTMAVRAGERALRDADLKPGEVDTIVLCSCTQPIEGARFATAVTGVQHELGLQADTHAVEVTGGSASAIYAFQTVEKCLQAGDDHVLLVAVNSAASHLGPVYGSLPSSYTSTIFIFGDGAGALLFSAQENDEARSSASSGDRSSPQVLAHVHETVEAQKLQIQNEAREGAVLYRINRVGVARSVLGGIPAITDKLRTYCEDHLGGPAEPNYYLFHQGNPRLLEKLIERMEVPRERVLTDIDRLGNLGPAEPLVLLDHARNEGPPTSGDRVLIATVGAGQQRSAALIEV